MSSKQPEQYHHRSGGNIMSGEGDETSSDEEDSVGKVVAGEDDEEDDVVKSSVITADGESNEVNWEALEENLKVTSNARALGIEKIRSALDEMFAPELLSSLSQLDDLASNQRSLLDRLSKQQNSIMMTKSQDIPWNSVVGLMNQLPAYETKVEHIHHRMSNLTTRLEKLRIQTQSLQAQAQRHAIDEEEKKAATTEWNVATATEGVTEVSNTRRRAR